MPGNRRNPPSYCHHKASGNAYVRLNGRDVYLGRFGTRTSLAEYDRVIAEWLAAGRTYVDKNAPAAVSVAELVNAFRKSDAIPPSHLHDYRAVMSLLIRTHSRRPVTDFGPLALKGVRKAMIDAGWNRQTINQRTYMLRRIFRWGVEHEMVSSTVYDALLAVEGLRAGKTTAPEPESIEPVAAAHVEACLPYMPATVQAMVKLQSLTGMRPGELCDMKTGEIDRTGKVWIYRPGSHKTAYKGKSREIAIGPKAQLVLAPYLKADPAAFIFTPRDSETIRRQAAHAKRKTPLKYGNVPGSNRKRKAARFPGDRYDVMVYRRAIYRAADAAFPPPPQLARRKGEREGDWKRRLGDAWEHLKAHREKYRWHPHQLRHGFATEVRRQFGLEHAQRALGHSNAKITEVYAGVTREKAEEVALKMG